MEIEREHEKAERERNLKEISDIKSAVFSVLQDPQKREIVEQKMTSNLGTAQLGTLLTSDENLAATIGSYYDMKYDDTASLKSSSSIDSSFLFEGSIAPSADTNHHRSLEEIAYDGAVLRSGIIFGVDLGKTKLRERREGLERLTATVISYKHPYFTAKYDNGETEDLTLNEILQHLPSQVSSSVHDGDQEDLPEMNIK